MPAPWSPPSEPPDPREQPECICPVEGDVCPGCPAHGLPALAEEIQRGIAEEYLRGEAESALRELRGGLVYPFIRIRDAAGPLRTGYKPEAEDEPEADIEY